MAHWSSTAPDEAIWTNAPGFESGETQLHFGVQVAPIALFFVRVPTLSLDLISYALFMDVLLSASRDHGGGSGILGRVIFRFR